MWYRNMKRVLSGLASIILIAGLLGLQISYLPGKTAYAETPGNLLPANSPIPQADPVTPVIYESYTTSNDQDNLGGTTWKGQTFTPAVTHTITKIRLPLLRQGSPSGNVVVSIRLTNASGLPTGSNLASGSIACSTLTTSWGPAVWYDFNLGTGYQLTAGTKYALIISAPSAGPSNLYFWVHTAGTYSKGTTIYSNNSGSSWSSYSGWDTAFEEWGATNTATNPVPTTTNISPTTITIGNPAFTLIVNGTNFLTSSVVRFAGTAKTTTYVSATQLTAAIPASDLTTAGTYNITVFNPTPGGGTSNAQVLTVNSSASNPVPTTTSVSPTTKTVGDTAFTLTVNGTNFLTSSVVRFAGIGQNHDLCECYPTDSCNSGQRSDNSRYL